MGRRDRVTLWAQSIIRSDASGIAKDTLKSVLTLAEKVLDGFPIPVAKGSIGAILEIIRAFEVGWDCTHLYRVELLIGRFHC